MPYPVLSVDNYELDTADCPTGEATKWIDQFSELAKCLHTIAYLDAAISEEGSDAVNLASRKAVVENQRDRIVRTMTGAGVISE